jgi:hypothetical protein
MPVHSASLAGRLILVILLSVCLAGCQRDDLSGLTVDELIARLDPAAGADQMAATLELIRRGPSTVPALLEARMRAEGPMLASIDSVLTEHDYFYFEALVLLFRYLDDVGIDVVDAAAGRLDEAGMPNAEQVARVLAELDEVIAGAQLDRRLGGLAPEEPERTFVGELRRFLSALREAIDKIRDFLLQNPGATTVPDALLRELTDAQNGARQNVDRILDGLPDYDGDGAKNAEELKAGRDPLTPEPAPGSAPPK